MIDKNKFKLIIGDSLKKIKTLDPIYNVIYLDPPFCSGRVYKFSQFKKQHGFSDVWNNENEYKIWLEKLIIECKSKLVKDGTLFFHISAEQSYIPETILRKHFSKVESIFWKKAHGKNTVKKKFGAVIDIIFKASNNNSKFNLIFVPLNEKYLMNSYRNKDKVGYYALGSLKHDKTRKGYFYTIKKNSVSYDAPYGWKITKSKMLDLIKEDKIHYSKPNKTNKGSLYKKLYKHESKGRPLSNLWDDISYITRTTKDSRVYPTQKPLKLLKRIIKVSSDEGDWILDPVAGSGTTGVASLLLNRNVTLIEINKDCELIINKRIKEVLKKKQRS